MKIEELQVGAEYAWCTDESCSWGVEHLRVLHVDDQGIHVEVVEPAPNGRPQVKVLRRRPQGGRAFRMTWAAYVEMKAARDRVRAEHQASRLEERTRRLACARRLEALGLPVDAGEFYFTHRQFTDEARAQLDHVRQGSGVKLELDAFERLLALAEAGANAARAEEERGVVALARYVPERCSTWVHPGTDPRGGQCVLAQGHTGIHQAAPDPIPAWIKS